MNFTTLLTAFIGLWAGNSSPSAADCADSIVIYRSRTERFIASESASQHRYGDTDGQNIEWGDIYTRSYDSLAVALREKSARTAYENFYRNIIDIESETFPSSDNTPDSVYEARLKKILSPIQMPYNEVVKRYITAYTTSRKNMMEDVMGRAQYYFPMIEAALDRYGLPLELRMLPVIESALTPTAVSRAGAAGLWQFMFTTGRSYGLEVSSFVDQRRDPELSTDAACRYLGDLYGIYGDWSLALAAYNCGPGNVNKAIRRAGGDAASFWDIYPYLPRETRGYVPSFIAATYAYTYAYRHDIAPSATTMPLATDTVMISRPLHFDQISSTIDLPNEVLRSLNPQYKMDIVPATGRSYALTLPAGDVPRFLDRQADIAAKDSVYLAHYLNPANLEKGAMEAVPEAITYHVKSGDTLSKIASRHHVTVKQLMQWNGLKSANKLRIGQRIKIYR